jgi:hypothetical protein
MVATMANTARRLGFATIEGDMLTGPQTQESPSHNGAYTFARLGFDCEIPSEVRAGLPEYLHECRTLAQLFDQPGGADHWRRNASSARMIFYLSEGSSSWPLLNSYLTRYKIRINNE